MAKASVVKVSTRSAVQQWGVRFRGPDDCWRLLRVGDDRPTADEVARKIRKLLNAIAAGERPEQEVAAWIDSVRPRWRERFAEWGLIDGNKLEARRPLSDQLDAFKAALAKRTFAGGRKPTPKRVKLATASVRAVLVNGCGFATWADVTLADVDSFLGAMDAKPLTVASHAQSVKQFATWISESFDLSNPLKTISPRKYGTHPEQKCRVFSSAELRLLILHTDKAEPIFGMSGPDRAVLYDAAVQTGLRRGSLLSLTVGSFRVAEDNAAPTVTVEAPAMKRRKQFENPLRPETAAILRDAFKGRSDTDPAFPGFGEWTRTAVMVRRDLANARTAWIAEPGLTDEERKAREKSRFLGNTDADGRVAEFRSFRATTATFFLAAGVHAKVAQEHLDHASFAITMDMYAQLEQRQYADALAALPSIVTAHDLVRADENAQRKGGSTIVPNRPKRAVTGIQNRCASGEDFEQLNGEDGKPLILVQNSKPPTGFEPATCSLQVSCSAN